MPPKKLCSFMAYFLRDYPWVVFGLVLAPILAGFWGPFNTQLVRLIVNALATPGIDHTKAVMGPAALLVLNFFFFDNLTWRTIDAMGARYRAEVRNKIISTTTAFVLAHSHQYFQDNLSGRISSQITMLADGVERIVFSLMPNFFRMSSLVLTVWVMTAQVHPTFFEITSLWAGFCFIFWGLGLKKLEYFSEVRADEESNVTGQVVDSITNQNNVRSFSHAHQEIRRFQPFLKTYEQAFQKESWWSFGLHACFGTLMTILLGLSAYFLVRLYDLKGF